MLAFGLCSVHIKATQTKQYDKGGRIIKGSVLIFCILLYNAGAIIAESNYVVSSHSHHSYGQTESERPEVNFDEQLLEEDTEHTHIEPDFCIADAAFGDPNGVDASDDCLSWE
eukprot:scaffold150865_cov16-Prasinocladus_malaysianus.AAC.1